MVCLVDIGQDEKVQIVTGATNVFEGAYVPVILHGGKLPDGTKIKKGKLRGTILSGCHAQLRNSVMMARIYQWSTRMNMDLR